MKLKIIASTVLLGFGGAAIAASANNSGGNLDVTKEILTQNQNMVRGNDGAHRDWYKRICLSGELNVDAIYSDRGPAVHTALPPSSIAASADSTLPRVFTNGNQGSRFGDEDSFHEISVADANLYIDAVVNDWASAHIALLYQDNGKRNSMEHRHHNNYDDQVNSTGIRGINLDEAFIFIGDNSKTPLWARVGRQYVPFGFYDRHPVTKPLTQFLSETRGTAVTLGLAHDSGFSASVYAFSGLGEESNGNGPVKYEKNGNQLNVICCYK